MLQFTSILNISNCVKVRFGFKLLMKNLSLNFFDLILIFRTEVFNYLKYLFLIV
jgi:hypothetical protein